ncbi:MAG: hypothetical protein QOJ41_2910 [Acidobacteriaceae bacterium]|nr:hypothetical protein [Acidobacteriaceae bacterium]
MLESVCTIVRCVPIMRRIFSSAIPALLAGACLRFFFVLQYPAGSGDTALYEQIATNWLKHHVYAMNIGGALTPTDIRMPGYPAFLAVIYWLCGKTGADARLWVMSAQVMVDLLTCAIAACLAVTLLALAIGATGGAHRWRVFLVALWLTALCPFTANYGAVGLTETLATFFSTLTILFLCLLCLLLLRFPESIFWVKDRTVHLDFKPEWFAASAGISAGLGTLCRPETPLLLITACLVLPWYFLRGGQWSRQWPKQWREMIRIFAFMTAGCILPLMPWAVRNAITLHEAQLLAPKNATLPGELEPFGFMAWEKTWLFRVRDCYLVAWKLNGEQINTVDIPARAFDTPEEKERVTALLEQYNDEITLTPEEDAGFAQLAGERTARHPLRTYLWLPAARAFMLWFSPRIELLPFSGQVFPLAEAWENDPVDQSVTVGLVLLNVVYVFFGVCGAVRLWAHPSARVAVALIAGYIVVRTAFLAMLETPEPRYTLVCFPALLAVAAQVFAGKGAREESSSVAADDPMQEAG